MNTSEAQKFVPLPKAPSEAEVFAVALKMVRDLSPGASVQWGVELESEGRFRIGFRFSREFGSTLVSEQWIHMPTLITDPKYQWRILAMVQRCRTDIMALMELHGLVP